MWFAETLSAPPRGRAGRSRILKLQILSRFAARSCRGPFGAHAAPSGRPAPPTELHWLEPELKTQRCQMTI